MCHVTTKEEHEAHQEHHADPIDVAGGQYIHSS
jgi:hypothetical protein